MGSVECHVSTNIYNYLLKVSTPLLVLRLTSLPTLFYCHFPDLLLSQGRQVIGVHCSFGQGVYILHQTPPPPTHTHFGNRPTPFFPSLLK